VKKAHKASGLRKKKEKDFCITSKPKVAKSPNNFTLTGENHAKKEVEDGLSRASTLLTMKQQK